MVSEKSAFEQRMINVKIAFEQCTIRVNNVFEQRLIVVELFYVMKAEKFRSEFNENC